MRPPSLAFGGYLGLCAFALFTGLARPSALPSPPVGRPIRDMTGHDLRLDAAQRFLVAANVMPAFATLAGGVDRIAAATWLGRSGMNHVLLDRIFPRARAIPSAGSAYVIEPERALLVAPDAVLGWAGQGDALIAAGYTSFATLATDGSHDGDLRLWGFLAHVAATDGREQFLAARVKAASANPKSKLGDKMSAPVRVLVLLSNTREIWVGPQRLPLTQRLEAALASNIAPSKAGSAVDIEEVARLDPDVILISTNFANLVPMDLFGDRRWRVSRAVREQKVYLLPNFPSFCSPVFDPLIIQWLAETLHPENTPMKIRAALREAYRSIYGYDVDDFGLDLILNIQSNRRSTGYSRFAAKPLEVGE